MERKIAWEKYDDLKVVFDFNEDYKKYISDCKTEWECVVESIRIAEKYGYRNLNEVTGNMKKILDFKIGHTLFLPSMIFFITYMWISIHQGLGPISPLLWFILDYWLASACRMEQKWSVSSESGSQEILHVERPGIAWWIRNKYMKES